MADLVDTLAEQGRALPPEERGRLMDLLLESLHKAPAEASDESWDAEIVRRVAAHERGEGKLYDVDEVMDEAARLAP